MRTALVFPYGFETYSPPVVMSHLYAITRKHGETKVFDFSIPDTNPLKFMGKTFPKLASQLSYFFTIRNLANNFFTGSKKYRIFIKNPFFKKIRNSLWKKHLKKSVKQLEKFNPDVIAISMPMPYCYPFSRKIAEHFKKKHPETRIIYGGYFATHLYQKILEKDDYVDYVVPGTSNAVINRVFQKLKHGQEPKIPGVAYKEKGKVKFAPAREEELEIVPDFSWADWSQYPHKQVDYGLSTGCTHNCKFCTNSAFWKGYSEFSLPEQIKNVKKICEENGIRDVDFTDSSLNTPKKRMREVCDEITKQELKIRWIGSFRAQNFDKESVKKLEESGCRMACIGVESGSEEILKKMNKQVTKQEIIRSLAMFKNSKIHVPTTWILGFPEETHEQALESVNFALKLLRKGFIHATSFTAGIKIDTFNRKRFEEFLKDKKEKVKFEELTSPEIENHLKFYWKGLWLENGGLFTQKTGFNKKFSELYAFTTRLDALTGYFSAYKDSKGLKKMFLNAVINASKKSLLKAYNQLDEEARRELSEFKPFMQKQWFQKII